MMSLRASILLGVAFVLCGAAPVAVAQPSAALPDGLQTISLYSKHVGRQMKYDIVLPAAYGQTDRDYPVLYLLHGFMQNYTVWGRNLGAARQARQLDDLILVMPDGGNSWYVNYAESHDGQVNRWEDYLIEELITHVDSNFRTIDHRNGRSIAGLSMGGYGAVMLGLRHPGLFLSVASTSGALGFARQRAGALEQGMAARSPAAPRLPERLARAEQDIADIIDIEGFATQSERTPSGIAFLTAEQARAYDPFTLVYQVPRDQLPFFHIDAGTEDRLAAVAREFTQLLMLNNVPVSFMQAPGGHDADYWRESVAHFMPLQYTLMRHALDREPGHDVDPGRESRGG